MENNSQDNKLTNGLNDSTEDFKLDTKFKINMITGFYLFINGLLLIIVLALVYLFPRDSGETKSMGFFVLVLATLAFLSAMDLFMSFVLPHVLPSFPIFRVHFMQQFLMHAVSLMGLLWSLLAYYNNFSNNVIHGIGFIVVSTIGMLINHVKNNKKIKQDDLQS